MGDFSETVAAALRFYVYRLEDPATRKTFYVGKGSGNRAFEHARAAIQGSSESEKLERIQSLLRNEQTPNVIIHRHGLDEQTAYEVEAALIDAYDISEISNQIRGVGVAQGMMTAQEVIDFYDAPPANIEEAVMLIKIEREWKKDLTADQLYERTRRYWVANPHGRRIEPRYAMAVAHGLIREVYFIERWEPYDMSTVTFDPTRARRENYLPGQIRIGFVGRVADAMSHYKNSSVRHLQNVGNQNPIKYVNC